MENTQTLTKDQVWRWMLEFQQTHGQLPKMEEIREAFDHLNWRSSVRHVLRTLVSEGRVVTVDEPGTARRYRAVVPEDSIEVSIPDLVARILPVTTIYERG